MFHIDALTTLLVATLATWAVVACSIGALWAWQRRRQLGDLRRTAASWDLATDSPRSSR